MRNSQEIKVWMLRNGHTIGSITQALGYRNNSCVSTTIAGQRHATRVLQYLLEQGCPARLLDLPARMQKPKNSRRGRNGSRGSSTD